MPFTVVDISACHAVTFCLQGFASGSLDDDAFAPRFFVDQGLEVVVSQSYSKNLGKPPFAGLIMYALAVCGDQCGHCTMLHNMTDDSGLKVPCAY